MLNVLSLFSGIGAFEKALTNLGIEHNVLAYCEIDPHASKSYSAIHGIPESMNLKDVTKVDMLAIIDYLIDLVTYGFPCQDISNAGQQKGFFDENGDRTRSGLFFEALRIIGDYRPKFAIAENVKALVSKKFTGEFKTVLESLEELGYNNYYAVLNAKDYGIPQNRDRVFIISIRKDIDKGFEFPDPIPLELKLKDLLEDEVDEKYYIDSQRVETLLNNARNSKYCNKNMNFEPKEGLSSYALRSQEFVRTGFTEECNTIAARDYKDPKCVCVKEATKKGYSEAYPGDSINLEQPNSKTRRGRVGKSLAQTLTCSCNQAVVESEAVLAMSKIKIRKLTPTECFKLMGFTAEDCKKASDRGISNTQLYKQAGNSIVVNVLEAIFKSLGERYEEFKSVDNKEDVVI